MSNSRTADMAGRFCAGDFGIHLICGVLSVVVTGTGYEPVDAGLLSDVLADRFVSIRADHPLRIIRELVNTALAGLERDA